MLLAPLFSWKGSKNNFHLPYKILTPTLFDVVAIPGVSPLGETFDPTLSSELEFNFNHATINKYILEHHDNDSVEVSDLEHMTFLTFWLSYYMFFSGSLQVAKAYIPLSI